MISILKEYYGENMATFHTLKIFEEMGLAKHKLITINQFKVAWTQKYVNMKTDKLFQLYKHFNNNGNDPIDAANL